MVSFSRCSPTVEILESRIAPAAVLSFLDSDGIEISIATSKGTVAQLQAVLAGSPAVDAKTTLLELDFSDAGLAAAFKGTDLTITAGADLNDAVTTRIGFINAAGLDLGIVVIDGDISRFDAGDSNSVTPAFKSLQVATWGLFDLTPASIEPGEFDSTVIGGISALTVKGNFQGAFLKVRGSDSELPQPVHFTDIDGQIGSLTIGGSLLGTARENGGSIFATGPIGKIVVTGVVQGFGNPIAPTSAVTDQDHNARIFSGKSIGAVSVGSVQGGDGLESGQIASVLGMGTLTLSGDIQGGRGKDSGAVGSGGVLGKVTINGSVIGGPGERSGSILSSSVMQAVHITGDVIGGAGADSGFIAAEQSIKGLVIDGSILGGSGQQSGAAGSGGPLGAVVIGGDVSGGTGASSGQIVSIASIKSVNVGGNLVGGGGFESGAIGTLGNLGPVVIGGDIIAGSGDRSGMISTEFVHETEDSARWEGASAGRTISTSGGSIASVAVGGSIRGIPNVPNPFDQEIGPLSGQEAGGIRSGGKLGPVRVIGNIYGGDNFDSGSVFSHGSIASVTILGSILGGSDSYTGSIRTSSGGNIGAVLVGGNIIGGNGASALLSGSVYSSGSLGSVTIGGGRTDEEQSGGSLIGGRAPNSGTLYSSQGMGAVTIHGAVSGGIGSDSGRIDSLGNLSSVTIGQSLLGGSGANSGGINALSISSVRISGLLSGGFGAGSGFIAAKKTIGSVEAGSVVGGGFGLGIVAETGDTRGAQGGAPISEFSRPRIAAGDAIKSVSVADLIFKADIVAGLYSDASGVVENANAQIGTVQIGTTGSGNMSATNIVASARTGSPETESDDGFFGTSDDAPLGNETGKTTTSKIASVIVKGLITGTQDNRGDHFGIVARTVASLKIGGESVPLKNGPFNDNLPVGSKDTDVSVRELGVQAPDGFVDRLVKFFDGGNGPRKGPYGKEIGSTTINQSVDPAVIVGPPPASPVISNRSHVDFVSLPTGSFIIAEFLDEYVTDGPGNDLFIQSLDDAAGEFADIYVGESLNKLVKIKKIGEGGSASIDLADAGYTSRVRFVKVVGLDNGGGAPGFDLVSISGLNTV